MSTALSAKVPRKYGEVKLSTRLDSSTAREHIQGVQGFAIV
ncbi:hypothetical protein [Serratia symbiotica]|nr:hypothetical protein [Serratia symbiotica]